MLNFFTIFILYYLAIVGIYTTVYIKRFCLVNFRGEEWIGFFTRLDFQQKKILDFFYYIYTILYSYTIYIILYIKHFFGRGGGGGWRDFHQGSSGHLLQLH